MHGIILLRLASLVEEHPCSSFVTLAADIVNRPASSRIAFQLATTGSAWM